MDTQLPTSLTAASRRELTVYDSPPRRTPEEDARDRAKQVEAHPFLYYLAQFVPGLQPQTPVEAAAAGAGPGSVEAATSQAAAGVGLWGKEAANRLFDAPGPVAERGAEPQALAPVVMAPPSLNTAPIGPVADAEPMHVAAPIDFPRIVVAQIDRMAQNGAPAATLKVQLEPPNLGKVDLAFTYAQQKVSVNVVAATQQAKDQLEIQLSQIRGILHAHHLPTGELKVMLASEAGTSGGPGQNADQDQDPQQPQRYRRRRRAAPLDEALGAI